MSNEQLSNIQIKYWADECRDEASDAGTLLNIREYKARADALEELLELRAEVIRLETENIRLSNALDSAGEWIAAAEVSIEPGWEGSKSDILRQIEFALAIGTDKT